MPAHKINASVVGRYEVGVIAGNRGLGLGQLLISGLPKPNDGVVTVEETRLRGMKDHIVMKVSHSGMLFSSRAAHEVCAFLKDGRFSRR